MTTVSGWIAIATSIPVWLYFFARIGALIKFIRSGGPTQLERTNSPVKLSLIHISEPTRPY